MRDRDRKVVGRRVESAAGACAGRVGLQTEGNSANPLPAIRRRLSHDSGFTLLELIIALTVIAILTAGTLPIARNMIKREHELELRRSLREIRKAIEVYQIACRSNQIPPLDRKDPQRDECYPPDLDLLVKGVNPPNSVNKEVLRFLRRIPKDPMTGTTEWGLRSVQDDYDSTSWGGQNVYDVYTKSSAKALDGSKYSDW